MIGVVTTAAATGMAGMIGVVAVIGMLSMAAMGMMPSVRGRRSAVRRAPIGAARRAPGSPRMAFALPGRVMVGAMRCLAR